jgi:hypothetical protein
LTVFLTVALLASVAIQANGPPIAKTAMVNVCGIPASLTTPCAAARTISQDAAAITTRNGSFEHAATGSIIVVPNREGVSGTPYFAMESRTTTGRIALTPLTVAYVNVMTASNQNPPRPASAPEVIDLRRQHLYSANV